MLKRICSRKFVFRALHGPNAIRPLKFTKNLEERKEILPKLIESSLLDKPSDWKNVRSQLLEEGNGFTEKSVDSLLLNYCVSNKKYDYAKKYIAFLQEANIKPNLGTIGKYFKLYYMMSYDKLTNEEEEENILKIYEDLRKEYKFLDSITIEQIICGLSITRYWKMCVDLLQESKITAIPSNMAYNVLITAAFRNSEIELGWQLFNEMIENNRVPQNITYETILSQLKINKQSTSKDISNIEKLFDALDTHDLHFDKEIANSLINTVRHLNMKASSTRILTQGVCSNCNVKLKENKLTNKEFSILKEAFFKEVIIGKNVFCKTTPAELERFKLFVKNMGTFDVVIDGLNTQYSQGVGQSPQIISRLLADVVNHFIRQDKTVLLLGRSHMEKLPAKNWNFIKKNSTVFLTHDISQDDPFILYCALHSGIHTNIVTRDLMRSHLYLLKDKQCKKLFRRWLAQHRLHLVTVQKGEVIFKEPLRYMVTPQKTGNKWHVPYIHEITEIPKLVKYKWICMSK